MGYKWIPKKTQPPNTPINPQTQPNKPTTPVLDVDPPSFTKIIVKDQKGAIIYDDKVNYLKPNPQTFDIKMAESPSDLIYIASPKLPNYRKFQKRRSTDKIPGLADFYKSL